MGVYDAAPLVRIGHNVSFIADEWTIIHPIGNITYPRYSDPFYFIQAKPGAKLKRILIDSVEQNLSEFWSFKNISKDHVINAYSEQIKDRIHVFLRQPHLSDQLHWRLSLLMNQLVFLLSGTGVLVMDSFLLLKIQNIRI